MTSSTIVSWPDFKLIAHRGASAVAPENTLPALYAAHAMGALWVEFDVVLSQDGEPFIFHDERLERTTNGRGFVADTPASVLKSLDAGSWFSPAYKNTPIATLAEWLVCAAKLKMAINLEIKPLDHREVLLVDVIMEALAKYWPENLPPPLLSSFSINALSYVRSRFPDAKLGLLLEKWRSDWQHLADELACSTVNLASRAFNRARVRAIHESGRIALAYTINDIKQAQRLFAIGVDGVFSNHVDFLEEFI